jgi:hypothetical protein
MIAQLASSSDFAISSAPVGAGDVNLFARYSDRTRHLRALRTCRPSRVGGPPPTSGGALRLRLTQNPSARGLA